ncbi:hypothetical protein J437_LFUL016327 [Ladona fulva]|uniref:Gamma-interferon-inducible lysosomal thiol reductase n=1 Tax=Ladona fulva TaxID=123851 RepID=A0A8K0KNZ0_LADFU|nr:hypothetical protein J437_LFUL016327 [Ladona fulva]
MSPLSTALLALAFLLASSAQDIEDNRVNVSLYYESLCPDSVRFVVNELQPTWEQLAGYMNIRFIPFGKSWSEMNRRKERVFRCQHGPRECLGNKMQSCGLSLLPTQESQVKFVTCVMSKQDPSSAGPECCREVGLDFLRLRECYYSSLSDELQLEAEQETNSIRNPLRFVPTIVYNGVFNPRKQDESLYNFKAVVCSQIPQPPEACLA